MKLVKADDVKSGKVVLSDAKKLAAIESMVDALAKDVKAAMEPTSNRVVIQNDAILGELTKIITEVRKLAAQQSPRQWQFTITRDRNGLMQSIRAART